jgi:hypothetical protein
VLFAKGIVFDLADIIHFMILVDYNPICLFTGKLKLSVTFGFFGFYTSAG